MTIEQIAAMLQETGIPFAYDHFAEGESPEPPFICYLLPGSDNFAADGRVYFKINEVRIELYTDKKFFITRVRSGFRKRDCMRSCILSMCRTLKKRWRYESYG